MILNYWLPESVFLIVTSIATFAALWIWGTIVIIQMRSRQEKTPEEIAKLKYPTIFYPYGNYFALAILAMVCVMLALDPNTRIAMIVGPLWIVLLLVVYRLRERKQVQGLPW